MKATNPGGYIGEAMSNRGRKSRRKGANGEREARDAVRQHWHAADCIRARQANGAYSSDVLYAAPQTHVEVKRLARIAALKALRQAERDAAAGDVPVVLMREDGDKEWTCMCRVSDVIALAERIACNMGRPIFPLNGATHD